VQYVDGVSKTIDYRKDDIILYDAHYKNFILDEATGDLVPIDLQIKRLNS